MDSTTPGPQQSETVGEAPLRVLIADDEPALLEQAQKQLRGLRGQWNVRFVASLEEALLSLAESPAEVVAVSLHMAGESGHDLLGEVRRRFPKTVRVAMVGASAKWGLARFAGVAHQYVPRPASPQILISTLARSLALSTLLGADKLKRLVGELDALPSLGATYGRLLEELRLPEPAVGRVGDIIADDLGMSAKVLQLVNSAFFGLRRRILSPPEAVMLLGLQTITALVVAENVFALFDEAKYNVAFMAAIQSHSQRVASFARETARAEGAPRATYEAAFIAGLLHDVGKLILAAKLASEYDALVTLADKEGLSLEQAERRSLGTSHAELGAYLLTLWGFTDQVVEAVTFHHSPSKSLTSLVTPLAALHVPLTGVHVANVMEHEVTPENRIAVSPNYDIAYLTRLDLMGQLAKWQSCPQFLEGETAG